jgi:hypothetical protein
MNASRFTKVIARSGHNLESYAARCAAMGLAFYEPKNRSCDFADGLESGILRGMTRYSSPLSVHPSGDQL